jgi:hypothetical protein
MSTNARTFGRARIPGRRARAGRPAGGAERDRSPRMVED